MGTEVQEGDLFLLLSIIALKDSKEEAHFQQIYGSSPEY